MKYYLKIALQHYAMGLIIPIAIVWRLQNGLSLPEVILTESIVLLTTALADLPAGFIANKINNKRSLLVGAALHVAGMALLAWGSSFAIFVIAAIFTGAAWAFISGADEAYIHDDFIEDKKEYKKVFATSTIVDEATTLAGMLSASLLLYLSTSLQALFVLASVVLVVHFFYTLLYLPASQPLPALHPAKAVRLFAVNIMKDKRVTAIVPLMIAFGLVYEAGRPLWQPHMQQLGIDIASFGVLFAVFKLASLGGSAVARFREFKSKDVGIVFACMLVALLGFGSSLQVLSIVALSFYLFTENYFRIYMSTVMNRAIEKNRAAVLSYGSVIRNASGAVILAGLGVMAGAPIFVILLALVAIKIPAMVYILLVDRRRTA